jgi:hypothetical protein
MRARSLLALLALAIAWAALSGCDRNMEPFVPGEEPRKPDLSKIFPAGAERSAEADAGARMAGSSRGAAPMRGSGSKEAIRGRVELAEGLSGRVPPGAVLFVIARRGSAGQPMAVKRIASPRFPLEFAIGPDDRLTEAAPFDGPLQLTALIDADGNATTRNPGDLQGALPDPVAPGASGLTLTIDELL